jgi:hypothetical protein
MADLQEHTQLSYYNRALALGWILTTRLLIGNLSSKKNPKIQYPFQLMQHRSIS